MRPRAGGLLLLLAWVGLAACGGGTPEQERATVAEAIDAVSATGARLDVRSTITERGGSIPKGRYDQIKMHAVGTTRDGSSSLRVSFAAPSGKSNPAFDVVITEADVYAQLHGGAGAWRTQTVEAANFLFVPARLPLLRETAILADRHSSGGLSHIDQGFARRYTFTPASGQLLQMLLNSFGGSEADFLKTASGHIDFFIGTNGRLLRIETHLSAINPETSLKRQIDAVTLFSGGSARPIETPEEAQPVATGSSLFTTGP